ncbi:MAG: aminoglycoside phosphotransferase, partial [Arthrobacter sp.]|nr:aminoglycoside phosphotransferase [Arthrobacter sp.]
SAEFALAQYLVKGIAAGDATMVAEAEEMLATLASDIAEHGGQPISIEPLPSPAAATVPAEAAPASVEPAAGAGAGPGLRAADGDVPAAVPPVTVFPVPAVQPAVHVTPIPVDPTPAPATPPAGTGGGAPDAPGGPDDTSTAALTIVEANKR